MKKILVLTPPEDVEDRAIMLGAEIARRANVELTLLRVISPLPEASHAPLRAPLAGLLETMATDALESSAEALRRAGIDVRVQIDHGVAWQAVLDRVEQERFDMVVKPASGLGSDGPVFFGSTALHLFRRCPCPVWVVGDEGGLPDRVVAAVDPTEGARRRRAADSVLDWAEEIASWSDAEPEVVSAWSSLASIVADLDLDEAERKRDEIFAHRRTEEALDCILLERGSTITHEQVHLVEGSPTVALPRFAGSEAADLLVMGTLSRPDAIGDLIGETAESVIRQVRCSVLTIPPGSHPCDARAELAASRATTEERR